MASPEFRLKEMQWTWGSEDFGSSSQFDNKLVFKWIIDWISDLVEEF